MKAAVLTFASCAAALACAAAPVTFDAAQHTVTITATSTDCGLDTPLEFLLVGPDSDHAYESMFTTEATVAEIAAAFEKAGIPCGRPVDVAAARFWPVGVALEMEPAFDTFVKTGEGERPARIAYTGGTRDEKGIVEAATNMPLAVFAFYNLPQTLISFDDSLEQSATYGRFRPAVKIPQGETRTFTFRWNGQAANRAHRLAVAPGKIRDAFAALKATADAAAQAGAELDVLPDFPASLTVKETAAAAAVLRTLDSPAVKVNGFVDGQLFYLAYLPRESWRERAQRLCQPPEVHLAADGTARVVEIKEDWSGDDVQLEPKLIVTEHPCADVAAAAKLASKLAAATSTMLVYVPGDAPLGKVYEFLKHADKGILNWYVFSE